MPPTLITHSIPFLVSFSLNMWGKRFKPDSSYLKQETSRDLQLGSTCAYFYNSILRSLADEM